MDRVTTFNSYSSILAHLMRAESRQAQAQEQVSTGKRADDAKGFGGDSQALTAALTLKTRVDGFVDTAKSLQNKLDLQALSLSQVGDAAQAAREAVANAVANGRADGLMASLENLFGQMVQGLNAQHNGSYIFAGARTDTAPVSARTLSDLTAAPAASDVFRNDQRIAVQKIDESTTLKTGFVADAVGGPMFEVMRQIQAFNDGPDGPFTGNLTPAQTDFLTGLLAPMDSAVSGVTQVTAENGLLQNRADAALKTQQDRQDMLEGLIGDVSGVDLAEAVSRLTQAQTALQASAQVFATLKDTSLLNLLRP
jgi:flagellar hook-associated protein 3 FlgL